MYRLGKWFGWAAAVLLSNLDIIGRVLGLSLPEKAFLFAGLFLCFGAVNAVPNWGKQNFSRLGVMLGGETLMEICALSFTADLAVGIYCMIRLFPALSITPSVGGILLHVLGCMLWTGILVVNGFLRVYASSVQLGIRWRIAVLLFWWVPGISLWMFWRVCRIVREEYEFETDKEEQNRIRRSSSVCETRYPIVLVHGVFFRDRKRFNYWGRIPGELIKNGAVIYYGGQQSAAATAKSGAELKEKIMEIISQTGCEKVNIIAHSKGGLESRWAVSCLGLAPYVASLTTVNTPHEGCAFVDWLLSRVPGCVCDWISARYNGALKRLGDRDPDFYAAVSDLTARRCGEMNLQMPDMPGVYCQSVGSAMKRWSSAPFPLNLCHILVSCFEKKNDGLVGVESMQWGSRFLLASPAGNRGISHGDMIDLNRQNIRGFDVREFYVELVRDLKEKGF